MSSIPPRQTLDQSFVLFFRQLSTYPHLSTADDDYYGPYGPIRVELVESARGYWAAEGLRVTDATLYSSGGSPPSMMAAPLPCGLGRGRSTDEQRDSMGWSSPATLRGTS
jgi:hypothetical protein